MTTLASTQRMTHARGARLRRQAQKTARGGSPPRAVAGRNPRRGRLEPGRGAEPGGAVGALPGEVGLGAAEVAVGRGLRVDRAEQVEVGDDGPRPQGEDLR